MFAEIYSFIYTILFINMWIFIGVIAFLAIFLPIILTLVFVIKKMKEVFPQLNQPIRTVEENNNALWAIVPIAILLALVFGR